jgi:hypothetical protein
MKSGIESDYFNRPLHVLEFSLAPAPSPDSSDWAIIIRPLKRSDETTFVQSPVVVLDFIAMPLSLVHCFLFATLQIYSKADRSLR